MEVENPPVAAEKAAAEEKEKAEAAPSPFTDRLQKSADESGRQRMQESRIHVFRTSFLASLGLDYAAPTAALTPCGWNPSDSTRFRGAAAVVKAVTAWHSVFPAEGTAERCVVRCPGLVRFGTPG